MKKRLVTVLATVVLVSAGSITAYASVERYPKNYDYKPTSEYSWWARDKRVNESIWEWQGRHESEWVGIGTQKEQLFKCWEIIAKTWDGDYDSSLDSNYVDMWDSMNDQYDNYHRIDHVNTTVAIPARTIGLEPMGDCTAAIAPGYEDIWGNGGVGDVYCIDGQWYAIKSWEFFTVDDFEDLLVPVVLTENVHSDKGWIVRAIGDNIPVGDYGAYTTVDAAIYDPNNELWKMGYKESLQYVRDSIRTYDNLYFTYSNGTFTPISLEEAQSMGLRSDITDVINISLREAGLAK